MSSEFYLHPALDTHLDDRIIAGVVESVTFRSDFIQIFSLASPLGKDIVFAPRKIFSSDINIGFCCAISGEDRHKAHYGDIFIAESLVANKPSIELFYLYSIYNFHFLDGVLLKEIIDDDRQGFTQAVVKSDIDYFISQMKLPKYLADKFLSFSKHNLRLK